VNGFDARSGVAAAAARLVVDEGMDYGPAKRKAARLLGAPSRQLPDNDAIEDAVREHLALFHADTQPAELTALRAVAREWMHRLSAFRPYLTGAVWRGTATRLSPVTLQLYCDDPKSAELALIDMGIDYDVANPTGSHRGSADVLTTLVSCPALGERVELRLVVLDHDDLRGALRPDARGRSERGDLRALDELVARSNP
jgi:hypothetical protein